MPQEVLYVFISRSDSSHTFLTMDSSQNQWTQAANKQGLVSIGTHSPFLTTSGPPRTPSQPVIIVEAGLSDCSVSWKAVVREISPFARIYCYDRAGYGQSEPSPAAGTATDIAAELSALLIAAGLEGPYVMVGHSYSGILIREFVAANLDNCVGLVLVDTLQEDALQYVQHEWPFEALAAVQGSLNQSDTTGVSKSSKLTAEEWKAIQHPDNEEASVATTKKEYGEAVPSLMALDLKKQFDACAFGDRPVSVIKGNQSRDYEMIYKAGVGAGNGTVEEREKVRKFIDGIDETMETLQRKQLQLSKRSRLIDATGSGNQVHMQQPELIAEEVRWVLNSL
jgi:pimeloyl-ACP methyl ester carboxylesterase